MTHHIEIICIGNELLIGKIANTNAQWLAKRITTTGLNVTRITIASDDITEISKIVKEALNRKPKILITTGGLGPTFDDKTLEGIAKAQIDPIGSDVTKEKSFGSVETWMFKFELQSPVAGKIIKTNEAVKNDPSIINKDPYEAGWIAEIRPDNAITLEEELRDLMKPHQYKTWVSKVKFSSISAT